MLKLALAAHRYQQRAFYPKIHFNEQHESFASSRFLLLLHFIIFFILYIYFSIYYVSVSNSIIASFRIMTVSQGNTGFLQSMLQRRSERSHLFEMNTLHHF
jgi:hypothetical protein